MPKIWKYIFDPFEIANVKRIKDKESREAALEKVAAFVLESVLSDVGEAKSPVTGRAFKQLNPMYAKEKKGQGSKPIANLELSGNMLDKLVVKERNGKLELYVADPKEQGKVDGHNNFTGESDLPPRKFIPGEGETLRPDIRKGIRAILKGELD